MFKFSLEPVLALKEKVEDSKKKELGEATMYQERIYQEKLILEKKKDEALIEARVGENQFVDVSAIKVFNYYNQFISQSIEAKGKELETAKMQVEEKRNELLEAVKERKILDNLKAIHKEVFIEEEKRDEQRIMDDIVTYRFGRKERE